MKKFFIAAALVLGICAGANAQHGGGHSGHSGHGGHVGHFGGGPVGFGGGHIGGFVGGVGVNNFGGGFGYSPYYGYPYGYGYGYGGYPYPVNSGFGFSGPFVAPGVQVIAPGSVQIWIR